MVGGSGWTCAGRGGKCARVRWAARHSHGEGALARCGALSAGSFVRRCEALIEKRSGDRDGGDGDESGDAVELPEFGEIVKEQLEERDAKERDRSDAGGASFLPDSGAEQAERERRPADGVGEVAGEMAGEVEGERR